MPSDPLRGNAFGEQCLKPPSPFLKIPASVSVCTDWPFQKRSEMNSAGNWGEFQILTNR